MRYYKIFLTIILILSSTLGNTQSTPKNIIIIIGNGMGYGHLSTALVHSQKELALRNLEITGVGIAVPPGAQIPDEYSAATALACGKMTREGYLSVDSSGKNLKSILEWAREKGKATGLISTSTVVSPTLAAFYSHHPSPVDEYQRANDLFQFEPDIVIGGGLKYFTKGDENSLVEKFLKKKYRFVDKMKKLDKRNSRKALILLAEDYLPKSSEREDFLKRAWFRAFRTLVTQPNGFCLVIESAQIAWAAKTSNASYLAEEILDMDKTIENIYQFLGQDNETLILVVSNYDAGAPAIVRIDNKKSGYAEKWASKNPTAQLVPVFAHGPGAENFSGIYPTYKIYEKLLNLLK